MSNARKSESKIYGLHAVTALLNNSPQKITQLYLNAQRKDAKFKEIFKLAKQHAIPVELSNHLEKSTQGIMAICEQSLTNEAKTKIHTLDSLLEASHPLLLLILDGVQDPHNLGACIRTANASGADAVIIPADKSAGVTPTVKKVASGAAEFTPVITVTNLSRALETLKANGVWIYGMAGESSRTLYQENFKHHTAFVMGSEGQGLRRLTADHCDSLLSIPMQGEIESLNVSVAAGICLYEAVRQRKIVKN